MPETEVQSDVQTSLLPLAEAGLKKDPYNIITHDKRNLEAIENSIDECGFGRSIVLDADNTILAGNGTYEIAQKKNAKILIVDVDDPNTLVGVRLPNLTDRQKRRLALHDNRSSDLHKYDKQATARLNEAHPEQQLLAGIFSEREQEKMLRMHADQQPLAPGGTDEDDSPESTAVTMRPESGVRMVSIFCTAENQPLFIRKVRALSAMFNTTTVTDTVLAIVEKAHNEWLPKEGDAEVESHPTAGSST